MMEIHLEEVEITEVRDSVRREPTVLQQSPLRTVPSPRLPPLHLSVLLFWECLGVEVLVLRICTMVLTLVKEANLELEGLLIVKVSSYWTMEGLVGSHVLNAMGVSEVMVARLVFLDLVLEEGHLDVGQSRPLSSWC